MKIINTKLHGILDYSTAFVLILPWIVQYFTISRDTLILFSFGSIIFIYSFITDYEFGAIKTLPMKVHLFLDIIISFALITSPYYVHFTHYFNWPVIVGVGNLIVVVLSTSSSYKVTKRDLDITKP